MSEINNQKMALDEFFAVRTSVFHDQLGSDPYDLDEALSYSKKNAERGTVSGVLAKAKSAKETICVPRAGVGSWEGQRSLMAKLDEAGSGYLPITVDSLTRDLRFSEANEMLKKSTTEHSHLNGYPIVAHGVEATRKLIECFDKPVMIRANAVDLRICAETGFASGGTAFVSGPMYATLEYSKNATLTESIPHWQYIFRLMGIYTDAGIPVAEDAVGFSQSGTCSVPSLQHVGVVLDALIMAGQGIKHIMPYSMLQGAIAQDVASCLAVEILTQEYLQKLGFNDVSTYVASSDWNGAFPESTPDAYGLISANVFAAAIAQPPLNYVKTIHEGLGVPTAQGNADSIRVSRYLFKLIGRQAKTLWSSEIDFELELNLMQARAVLDAILDSGNGDPVVGSIKSIQTGVLDIPFSPNVHVRGNVLPIRDSNGAVRFLDYGNLPIPEEAKRMEKERLSKRSSDTSKLTYQSVVEDLEFLELDSEFSWTENQGGHSA
jgi:methylaspartate mutase epsilon subunit